MHATVPSSAVLLQLISLSLSPPANFFAFILSTILTFWRHSYITLVSIKIYNYSWCHPIFISVDSTTHSPATSCHSSAAVQTWPFLPFSSAVSPHSPTHPLPRPIALCSNVSPAPSLQQRGPDQTTVAWVVSADLQGNRSACHCHHCVPKMSLRL